MANSMTRRAFVRWLGVASAGVMVAGCSTATPAQPTTAPKLEAPAPPPQATAAPAAASTGSATAPATTPAQAPARDFQTEWDELIAAAKREGKVVVNTFPGTGFRTALSAFEEKFPGMTVEQTTLIAREIAPRAIQEQKAGIYSFDVTEIPATTALGVMLPEGAWDPIRPAIIHPEVVGDQHWKGGFERGFLDKTKQFGYGFGWNKFRGVWVNTDLVKPGEIQSTRDLLNPKWKGKIVLMDPRSGGFTANWVTPARIAYGDEYLKNLFIDQEPIITRDQRQATEMLIRGGHAIATGPNEALLDDFKTAGVTVNVASNMLSDATYIVGRSVWLFKKAPHPNAAKLFINWLLMRDTQEMYHRVALLENSRRADVPPIVPEMYPTADEEGRLIFFDSEDWVAEVTKTQELSTQILK